MPHLHACVECGSTNDVARSLAAAGAAHGTTVVADHQSAGRGRQGRAWADRPGASLLLSIVLRPARDAEPTAAAALPLQVGLAAARALRAACALDVAIEWPNDLVVADRKLGGILCESSLAGGRLDFVVAGLGINLAALPAGLDDATRARATSVADLAGEAPGRAELAAQLVRQLRALPADAPLAGADLEELRRLDSLADRPVRFGTGRRGTARGILPDGALAVEDDQGTVIEVRSGSVAPAEPRTSS